MQGFGEVGLDRHQHGEALGGSGGAEHVADFTEQNRQFEIGVPQHEAPGVKAGEVEDVGGEVVQAGAGATRSGDEGAGGGGQQGVIEQSEAVHHGVERHAQFVADDGDEVQPLADRLGRRGGAQGRDFGLLAGDHRARAAAIPQEIQTPRNKAREAQSQRQVRCVHSCLVSASARS